MRLIVGIAVIGKSWLPPQGSPGVGCHHGFRHCCNWWRRYVPCTIISPIKKTKDKLRFLSSSKVGAEWGTISISIVSGRRSEGCIDININKDTAVAAIATGKVGEIEIIHGCMRDHYTAKLPLLTFKWIWRTQKHWFRIAAKMPKTARHITGSIYQSIWGQRKQQLTKKAGKLKTAFI